ncbi:an1 family zinc finger domain-containing protein [Cystoisospora suis]|uniref:An1 family zinc finger domain-containing protein n=1 Tax=Cystoisospora suis TaxID=483139 RepID=A0A2C6KQ10_9APIC|nr:an1 family zinc finger domain-containing protein [Cystoisospora suis]
MVEEALAEIRQERMALSSSSSSSAVWEGEKGKVFKEEREEDTKSQLGGVAGGAQGEKENEKEKAEAAPPQQVRKNRCWTCNRKVGLLGFQCRCGYFYCGEHRYADRHNCGFDYKTFEREQLKKQNNRVVADKVQKF